MEAKDRANPGENLRAAGGLLRDISRLAKSLQLYQANNPVLVKAKADVMGGLERYLATHGELELTLAAEGAYIGEEKVAASTAAGVPMLGDLFTAGLRVLKFKVGAEAEVVAFVECVNAHTQGLGKHDDLIASIWEKELQFIDYEAVDPYFGTEEGRRRIADFVNDRGADALRAHAAASVYPEEAPPPARSMEVAEAMRGLSMDQLDLLRAEAEVEDEGNLVSEVLDAIVDVMLTQSHGEDTANLAKTLVAMGDDLLDAGKLNLYNILQRRVEVTAASESPAQAMALAIRQALQNQASSKVTLTKIADLLNDEKAVDPAELTNFMRSLAPASVSSILALAPRIRERVLRRRFAEPIATFGGHHLDLIAKELARASGDWLVELVSQTGHVKEPAVADILASLSSHPEAAVRIEVLTALARAAKVPEAPFRVAVSDANEEIRNHALRLLGNLTDGQGGAILQNALEQKNQPKRSQAEKNRFCMALARQGGDAAAAYLGTAVEGKPAGTRSDTKEWATAAILALAGVKTDATARVLSQLAASGPRAFRDQARQALQARDRALPRG